MLGPSFASMMSYLQADVLGFLAPNQAGELLQDLSPVGLVFDRDCHPQSEP